MAVQVEIDLVTRQAQANADAMTTNFAKMAIGIEAVRFAIDLASKAFGALSDIIASSIKDAIEYQNSIAEISTLFASGFDTSKVQKELLDLSSAFGFDQKDVAKGYYDTVSAGITDAAEASVVLNGAAKLAVGGVTDQKTAITGLTNILKGWGLQASETANISDALFIGAQVGKTTIQELSASIGQVSPLAAAAGVSYQEVVSALSALTLTGKTTAESATGLRGAIENLFLQ